MPFDGILEKYAAFGGKYVTSGGDAHSGARYCEKIAEVEKIIKKIRFYIRRLKTPPAYMPDKNNTNRGLTACF